MSAADSNAPTGMSVDASGGPVIDPTANVLQLVEASIKRLDDLRFAETQRIDDLSKAESRRVNEQSTIRADYEEKLRAAEAKRIDAIRAVDVNAVAVASERATQQANVLATQVAQSAEVARALVASTAAALATQLQGISSQLTDRILALEKSQYEIKGRAGFADPQMDALAREVEVLKASRSETSGKASGFDTGTKLVIALVGFVFLVMGGIATAVLFWIAFGSKAGGG